MLQGFRQVWCIAFIEEINKESDDKGLDVAVHCDCQLVLGLTKFKFE